MCKLDKTETLVTTGDMTYKGGNWTDLYSCMCLYIQFDSICVFSEFVWTIDQILFTVVSMYF